MSFLAVSAISFSNFSNRQKNARFLGKKLTPMNKRLSILSDLEEFAFYGLPDFNDEQRSIYFTFEIQEWELISTCPSLHTQVYCALQVGYFKAKNLFFPIHKIPQVDIQFILSRYFESQTLPASAISKYEYYLQRESICFLFGYKLWSHEFLPHLYNRAKHSVQRDISPNFIAHELLSFLQNEKIVRPHYSTLQKVISKILTQERHRLKLCLKHHLTEEHKQKLDQLLKNEKTLPALAALKQDAKNFKPSIMKIERQKHAILKPLYGIAQEILPFLGISQQNITHYANLINYYTIYDLKRFDAEQTYLYLLCYVFKRFQQINDNLVEAFTFQVKSLEKEAKEASTLDDTQPYIEQQIGRLILLYVDDSLSDHLTAGDMRKKAFAILPKETICFLGEKMVKKPRRKQNALWQEREKASKRYKSNLRPLFMKIHFTSQNPDNPLLEAIHWLQHTFAKHRLLSKQPVHKFPCDFISKRLSSYLFTHNGKGEKVIHVNRYEIFVYLQIAKQMETGSIYVTNSVRYRPFSHDLVSLEEKATILKALDIPWLRTPREEQLDSLFKELY
jgi:hypothetical protein